MNDARESVDGLDGRIDALTQEMREGFNQVQAGFEDHRLYTEFLVTGLRGDMNARFTQVDRRFDSFAEQVDRRFESANEQVNRRFDSIQEQMDQRFDAVNEQLKSADRRFESVERRFDAVDQRFDAVSQRFDAVDQRFDAVNQRFDRLERLIKGEEL